MSDLGAAERTDDDLLIEDIVRRKGLAQLLDQIQRAVERISGIQSRPEVEMLADVAWDRELFHALARCEPPEAIAAALQQTYETAARDDAQHRSGAKIAARGFELARLYFESPESLPTAVLEWAQDL